MQIKFHARPIGFDPSTHKPLLDPDGWSGILINRKDLDGHTGTHLARVQRPAFGSIVDDTVILASDVWARDAPYMIAYIVPEESQKTVKARINAFNKSDPRKLQVQPLTREEQLRQFDEGELIIGPGSDDGEDYYEDDTSEAFVKPQVDFTNQHSIVVGREVARLWEYDLLKGLSDEQIDRLLSTCTPLQRVEFRAVARNIPCGIFIVVGPAGTGKSTMTVRVLHVLLERGEVPLVTSSTNAAVNNICRRAEEENHDQKYLHVRMHPEHLEYARIISWRPRSQTTSGHSPTDEEFEAAEMDNAEKADAEVTLNEGNILAEEVQGFNISPSVDGDLQPEKTPWPRQVKRAKKYYWDQSVACCVLQSIGLVETSNRKLIRLQEKNTLLKELMLKDQAES